MSKEQNKDLFYTQSSEEVLKNLDSSVEGLSTAQAQERLANYGRNELEEGEKRSLLAKFLDQFKDLMIIILLVAAALSVITEGMDGLTDAMIILAVVVLNAAFGVYQEGQA
ncbi:MAG: cation-transporting P-type ATPase, partial [Streptococcus parasanguinis]|nr:cation-transporting P-type ATPase [Streptococcus parasanguinis]